MAVKEAQDGDNGKWTCRISTMDASNNAVQSSTDVYVTVAVAPTTVQLYIAEAPSLHYTPVLDYYGPKEYHFRIKDTKSIALTCVAKEARAPPKFSWFLDEDVLNGETSVREDDKGEGKKNFIETLKYVPSAKDDGKMLKCQVGHQAYNMAHTN